MRIARLARLRRPHPVLAVPLHRRRLGRDRPACLRPVARRRQPGAAPRGAGALPGPRPGLHRPVPVRCLIRLRGRMGIAAGSPRARVRRRRGAAQGALRSGRVAAAGRPRRRACSSPQRRRRCSPTLPSPIRTARSRCARNASPSASTSSASTASRYHPNAGISRPGSSARASRPATGRFAREFAPGQFVSPKSDDEALTQAAFLSLKAGLELLPEPAAGAEARPARLAWEERVIARDIPMPVEASAGQNAGHSLAGDPDHRDVDRRERLVDRPGGGPCRRPRARRSPRRSRGRWPRARTSTAATEPRAAQVVEGHES